LSIEDLNLRLMQTEFLIIGQGISGTWLSYYLQKENKSFLVIDNNQSNSASRVAAGIINPVTGRRIVKTWMIDELLAYLKPAYEALGKELGITAISQRNIIDFHPTPQMKISFDERLKDGNGYLNKPPDQALFRHSFHHDFGFAEINPAFLINLQEILPAWRKKLSARKQLFDENFDLTELKITENSVHYKNVVAGKIIFCDGIAAAENHFFKTLPFSLNKGEALIIESNGIPVTHIFKKGIMLAPLGNDLFWAGSNYTWDFKDASTTEQFRRQTEIQLKNWLKVPFKVTDHLAAIRPANVERRPFAGLHPVYKNISILNGMGTKGCSLAPYFAKQLTDHLLYQSPLHREADINRFQKILSRSKLN
jgi:glycine/D-amino acid oxidase-like deaminating enzyme